MMIEIEIFPTSFLEGCGHLQYGKSKWTGTYCIRYHMYLVSECYEMPDFSAFACGNSVRAGAKSDALFLRQAGSFGEEFVKDENTENESSGNSEKRHLELSVFNVKTESNPKNE